MQRDSDTIEKKEETGTRFIRGREVQGMGTVLEYLEKYGKYSFDEMPMTEVDSLALCQLSYLKFDGMVPGPDSEGKAEPPDMPGAESGGRTSREREPGGLPEPAPEKLADSLTELSGVALESLREHPDYEKLFADVRYEKPNRALYERMVQGKRFRDMKLNYYVNVIEERWETQFSAVTYTLGDGTHYVAYRGTDETIVGWKEDFNMAFLTPVPGQAISVEYLNQVAGRFDGPLYVGGHSKGGNLAVYSAMNCAPDIQERILKIYSMDGPGFRPEVLEKCDYGKIADRVVKILPNSSLVGMIFESGMYFQVVKSRTFGLLQHDPYTWLVTGNHLVRADHLYERRQQMDNNLNEWILSLNEEQLRTFVDTMYQVITASEANNLIDFTAEWKKSMNGVIAALKEVDGETVAALKEIVRSLFEITRENHKKQVAAKAEAALGKLAPRGKDGKAQAEQ